MASAFTRPGSRGGRRWLRSWRWRSSFPKAAGRCSRLAVLAGSVGGDIDRAGASPHRRRSRAETRRTLTWGAWLYALALIGAFVLRTPVGGNAARLGALLAAPLVAGVLWERRRLALVLLAPALLYWQLETPINDFSALAGNPSVNASYYAPLVGKLTGWRTVGRCAWRSR